MGHLRRRQFLWSAGALVLAPRARAQPRDTKVFRIGFLGIALASGYVREVEWIRAGLRDLGYTDGPDPVAAGLAKSFARPGGNVTGSTSFVREEIGKRLQLLLEILPRLKRLAFLYSTADAAINLKM